MLENKASSTPIVGVLLEPVQAEGGDNHATKYFFQQLRQLCTEVSLICTLVALIKTIEMARIVLALA